MDCALPTTPLANRSPPPWRTHATEAKRQSGHQHGNSVTVPRTSRGRRAVWTGTGLASAFVDRDMVGRGLELVTPLRVVAQTSYCSPCPPIPSPTPPIPYIFPSKNPQPTKTMQNASPQSSSRCLAIFATTKPTFLGQPWTRKGP